MDGLSPDLEHDRTFGAVAIGRGSYHGANCRFLIYAPGERIAIGRYCSIADKVTISAGGNHRLAHPSTWPFDNHLQQLPNPTRTYRPEPRPTAIGSDVWIGDSAHVGGGVEIGHGAAIGACAVVFSDVPPYAVVAGNPARILRLRFADEVIAALLRIAWWEWPPSLIAERTEWFYRPVEEFVRIFAPT